MNAQVANIGQQNAWFQDNMPKQPSASRIKRDSFLGPTAEFLSLQAQVNRLEELIKTVVGLPIQSQKVPYPVQVPNTMGRGKSQQFQNPASLHQGY